MKSHRPKHLLIIGGGPFQVPAIKTAKAMGLKVAVSDYNEDAEGMLLADFSIPVSTRNINLTVNAAKQFHKTCALDGVMTVGTDASQTVAAVADALNLPGIPFEVAERATDKIKMRQRLKEAGVSVPDFRPVWNLEEGRRAIKEMGLPLVIKPCDNMGARGVKKLTALEELPVAFREAKEASISGKLVIEEYMEGPELSLDALVFNDQIVVTGVADRIIERSPYFVEVGHTMPSVLPEADRKAAEEIFKSAIRAIGINIGAAKGDIKITSDGAKVVEIAARLSGGWMSTYTYPLATGVNLIKAAIQIAIGETPDQLEPKKTLFSAERALIPQSGKILSIQGVEEARRIKGVKEIILMKEAGDTVEDIKSNLGKTGYVISVGKTREEAIRVNDEARACIRIEVGAEAKLSWDAIRNNARKKFYVACKACVVCDGAECAGKVPGIGGIGSGESFTENLRALARYKINLRTIHNVKKPDLSIQLFGQRLSFPVLAAPITGMETNLAGGMDEREYADAVLNGCLGCGTLGMVGDGASPQKYLIGLEAIRKCGGLGIPIFKPREYNMDIVKRFKAAEDAGAIAVGIDIDAASFKTMALKSQRVAPKTVDELQELKSHLSVPFILKGIMNVETALAAIEAGADAIVVSNHGGRVMDTMPGTAEVLPEISSAVAGRVKVIVDGGIREGVDILKMLALGADAVMIGRPVCIAAFGAGQEGVEFYLNQKRDELNKAMILTGCARADQVDASVIARNSKGDFR
ncbi:MAG: ATP-grasp domain-containing protein [Candidatus Nitrohelix vancouverensis]|uniref:ATP-grasp domain-containing protein n=1 Tax=Candidatus Nitrohelix vancouverensis TaxID=2705534 RepID=A0A7T0C4E6_9BACT|nr:MAG: ATP-grasp domain-containing protein [Candidatus Nitrohelix vancouverensis]